MAFTVILFSVVSLVLLILTYVKWSHKYWARRNVPYIEPTSIFGNIDNLFKVKRDAFAISVKNNYDKLKRRGHIHGGIYSITSPLYIPVDPNLIKNIMSKDFTHFTSHGTNVDEKIDPLAANLFNLDGAKWKNMRTKLTPTFTSGKMKMMFNTLLDCGIPLLDHIGKLCKNNDNLDIKDILACYTTDVIGSCVFGLECNSFKDPNAEFRTQGRKLTSPSFNTAVRQFLFVILPTIKSILPMKLVPPEIEKFFLNTVKDIMDYRKSREIKRNDFIEMFLEMEKKAKASGSQGFTLNEIAAQSLVFFLAGFETSATTMSFCLHELAYNQEIQDKLREEVKDVFKRNNGKLTYESIMEMKYMEKVVNETLRKYPPVPMIPRECSQEYKVPNTDVVIEKGTRVAISALGLQRDEEYYPDPDKFDPERFNDENKKKRPEFTYLPFGEGPRVCIGLRFGLMQTKTGLTMLLNNYRVLPVSGENYNIEFDARSVILTKKGNLLLAAEKIST